MLSRLPWRLRKWLIDYLQRREQVDQERRRAAWNREPGIQIEPYLAIHESLTFDLRGGTLSIAPGAEICSNVVLAPYGGSIALGRDIYIGPNCVLYGHGGLTIGADVLIAANTVIIPNAHRISDLERPIRSQGEEARGITIEDDVWLGCGVQVLDGVRIGRGAVVGAGSVVTRDVAPRMVVVGSPARPLRRRDEARVSKELIGV